MSTFSRVLVLGYPLTEVADLDRELAAHGGGAQLWRAVGLHAAGGVVGVSLPDNMFEASWCRVLVEQWTAAHSFVLEPEPA